jgi:hypothetical protein
MPPFDESSSQDAGSPAVEQAAGIQSTEDQATSSVSPPVFLEKMVDLHTAVTNVVNGGPEYIDSAKAAWKELKATAAAVGLE